MTGVVGDSDVVSDAAAPGEDPAPGEAAAPGEDPARGEATATGEAGAAGEAATKGAQTRRLIVETAVRLVRERGYEKTTMRMIAQEAGVSVGNAYYYFGSKDALMQSFYEQIQHEHRTAVVAVLAQETELGARLRGVLDELIAIMGPYHSFAGRFVGIASQPDSPLSPFSADSGPARDASLAIYRDLVAGSRARMSPELRAELPELLWLAQLGVTLFWVHDQSPGQRRTRLLIDRAVPLVERIIGLTRLRVFAPVTREALALYRALR